MKAIARLVYTHFMGTPLTRALTLGGLALYVLSIIVVVTLPQSEHMLAVAMAGQVALFLGTLNMPLMVGRLSAGHAARLLPFGRVKLLLSAMLTVAIVALPTGLVTPFVYVAGNSGKLSDLARYPGLLDFTLNLGLVTYTSSCILAGWLYLAMWFIASRRDAAGFARGLLVIAILIFWPAHEIRELDAEVSRNVARLAVVWGVFGAGFLLWPRWKSLLARIRRVIAERTASISPGTASGREIDMILGTHNPWLLIAAQGIPMLILARTGADSVPVWLYFLTIFSVVNGALSGQAAERSRPLWLRTGWSREELFVQVEKSFARHNGIVLAAQCVLMIAISIACGFPLLLLAVGLPLLILGTVLSGYLGLMLTRGLRWPEACLGVAVMLVLMVVPLQFDTQDPDLWAIVAIEVSLAVLANVLRAMARRRWARIDWTQCRPPRLPVTRTA